MAALNSSLSCDLAAQPLAASAFDPNPLTVPPDWTLEQVAQAMSWGGVRQPERGDADSIEGATPAIGPRALLDPGATTVRDGALAPNPDRPLPRPAAALSTTVAPSAANHGINSAANPAANNGSNPGSNPGADPGADPVAANPVAPHPVAPHPVAPHPAASPSPQDQQPAPRRYSYALVVQDQRLQGIVTERDLVQLVAQGVDLGSTLARSAMTRQVITLSPFQAQDVMQCIYRMRQYRIRHLPVLEENGSVVGIVTATQAHTCLQPADLLQSRRVEEVMTTQVVHVTPTTTALTVVQIMAQHRISCVVVVDPQRGAMGQNTPDQGAIGENTAGQSVLGQESTDGSTADQNTARDSAIGANATDQSAIGENTTYQSFIDIDENRADQRTVNENTINQDFISENTTRDGAIDQDTAREAGAIAAGRETEADRPGDPVDPLGYELAELEQTWAAALDPEAGDRPDRPLYPIGIITERDIVQFQLLGLDLSTTLAQEIMSSPLFLMAPSASLGFVQQEMGRRKVRRFVIANAQGQMVGLVTQTSLLDAINPVALFNRVEQLQAQVQQLEAQQLKALQSQQQELQTLVAVQTHKLEGRQHWEQLLATLALKIRQSLDLQEILQTAATEVQQLLAVDRILFYQLSDNYQGTVVVEALSDPRWTLLHTTVQDECFEQEWAETYRLGRVTAIESVADALIQDCHREFLQDFQIQANAVVPIQQGETLWGLLIAHQCHAPRAWQADELRFLQQMGVQVGIALQQSALVEQLREAKESLEIKVAERTQTLAEANHKLFQSLKEREKITQKIRDRETFWRNIINTLATFVGVLTPEGTLTEVNEEPLQVSGIRREEVIGKPFWETYWWNYDPALQTKLRSAIAQARLGQSVRFDAEVRAKGDSFITIDFSLRPLINAAGEVLNLIPSAIDITDRKQAERDLRDSTLQLQDLFENASDLIQSVSIGDSLENSRVLYVNRRWCEVLGYDPEEATQLCLEDLLHPDSWEHCQELLELLHQGDIQQLDQMELSLVTRSGRTVVLQGNINVRYQQGKPTATRGIFRDITEHSHSSKALKATKEQFELVLRASQDGFWDWNLLSNEIYYSPRWKEMLGYADDELPNTLDTWKSLMHPEDVERALSQLEAYNQGTLDHFEMFQRFYHKNGSIVYTFSRVLHLKDETGQVIRMVGSHSDMSETMKMQKALQASQLQLTGILDSSLDGIMALRAIRDETNVIQDFEWILANPAACELLGCRLTGLDKKRLQVEPLDHPKDGLFSLYKQVVETGQSLQREFCDYDQHKTWLHIVVKMGDGCAVTFRDVTRVRESEVALQQANATLEQQVAELNQRHAEMVLLSDLSDFLQACLSLTEACQIITDLMPDLFPQCLGIIYSMNAAEGLVEPLATWGEENMVASLFHPQDCWALRRGRFHSSGTPTQPSHSQPLLPYHTLAQPPTSHNRRHRGMLCNHIQQTHAILPQESCCIPMIAQGETIGLLYISSKDSGVLSKGKQQLAQTVAEQIALAIANLRLRGTLEDQSIRDPLTQLYNRRHLKKFLTQTLHRAQHLGNPVGVIMMDVDHFKHFNDDFGHEAGDLVLQQVAQVLLDNIRSGDIACRYGGEELTLVLPQATLAATTAKAEVLCRAVRNLRIRYQGQDLRSVTISAGVACYPNHGDSAITLLQLADLALYRAKAQGRDQVQVALGGDPQPLMGEVSGQHHPQHHQLMGELHSLGQLPPHADPADLEDEYDD